MRRGLYCPDPRNASDVLAVAVSEQVCIVLGRALLFKIFDSSPGEKRVGGVAPQIRARVMDGYACLGGRNTLSQGENPVKKIPLGVIGVESLLSPYRYFCTLCAKIYLCRMPCAFLTMMKLSQTPRPLYHWKAETVLFPQI